jgi:oxepin-CoA hydrolase / 3-oxo-5,6-dehydrosuberyl-CoA semialdehyde dehydrogenase
MIDSGMIEVPFDINDEKNRHYFFTELLPQTVKKLDENMPPEWGKMSAQHMIEHLIWTLKISTGALEVSCRTPENILPRAKLFLHNNKETPHNYKNPLMGENPPALQYTTFIEAKTALLEELNKTLDHVYSLPEATHIHPVFGPLGKDEWQRIHFKHFYHHLLQFGLIKEPKIESRNTGYVPKNM